MTSYTFDGATDLAGFGCVVRVIQADGEKLADIGERHAKAWLALDQGQCARLDFGEFGQRG